MKQSYILENNLDDKIKNAKKDQGKHALLTLMNLNRSMLTNSLTNLEKQRKYLFQIIEGSLVKLTNKVKLFIKTLWPQKKNFQLM